MLRRTNRGPSAGAGAGATSRAWPLHPGPRVRRAEPMRNAGLDETPERCAAAPLRELLDELTTAKTRSLTEDLVTALRARDDAQVARALDLRRRSRGPL